MLQELALKRFRPSSVPIKYGVHLGKKILESDVLSAHLYAVLVCDLDCLLGRHCLMSLPDVTTTRTGMYRYV